MTATDAIKDDIHTIVRQAANFFDKILMLVVDRISLRTGQGASDAIGGRRKNNSRVMRAR
jgi:hypothetical protein